MKVDLLIFDATPEPFRKDIVESAAFAVHTDPHLSCKQALDVLRTGEMAALVAVPDFWRCDCQRPLYSGQYEGHFQRLVEFPTDDIPRVPVEYGYQVHPPSGQADVCNINSP